MTKTAIMAENKLILLYLIYQLDMPISWADLLDFAVPNYMDYMDFQIYLQEMVENGIVEKLNEDNGYFYSITEDGTQCIRYFSKRIPESKLGSILAYVRKNKSRIKKEYSVYANYFYYAENEYIVSLNVTNDWDNGFTGEIKIQNLSAEPIPRLLACLIRSIYLKLTFRQMSKTFQILIPIQILSRYRLK